jgi:hypothetical protein
MVTRVSIGGALLTLAVALLGGCTTLEVYSLQGQLYDVEGDCLGPSEVIDIIEGSAEGTCEGVKCMRSEETGLFWVTPNCEVPDLYVDLTDEEDGPCAAALAAFERGADGFCE